MTARGRRGGPSLLHRVRTPMPTNAARWMRTRIMPNGRHAGPVRRAAKGHRWRVDVPHAGVGDAAGRRPRSARRLGRPLRRRDAPVARRRPAPWPPQPEPAPPHGEAQRLGSRRRSGPGAAALAHADRRRDVPARGRERRLAACCGVRRQLAARGDVRGYVGYVRCLAERRARRPARSLARGAPEPRDRPGRRRTLAGRGARPAARAGERRPARDRRPGPDPRGSPSGPP